MAQGAADWQVGHFRHVDFYHRFLTQLQGAGMDSRRGQVRIGGIYICSPDGTLITSDDAEVKRFPCLMESK